MDRIAANFVTLLSGATDKTAKLMVLKADPSIADLCRQITSIRFGGAFAKATFTTRVPQHWREHGRGGPQQSLAVVVEPATSKETLQKVLIPLLSAINFHSILGVMKFDLVKKFLVKTLKKSLFERE